jgi:hypothetical protein
MGAAPSRDQVAPGEAAGAPRRALLEGSRPGHSGSVAPPGYELASAAAARVTAWPRGVPAALYAGRARDKPPAPVPFAAPVQQQAIVTNVVNLQKASLRLVRARDDPRLHLVHFQFDAQVDGTITVYHCATRVVRRAAADKAARVEHVSFAGLHDERPSKSRFSAGAAQRFEQKPAKGLDVVKYRDHLIYTGESRGVDRYPIVIRLEAVYPPDTDIPEEARVTAQTTFVTLTAPKVDGGPHGCAVVRQDVLVAGTLYKLQELYGIAPEGTASPPADGGGAGAAGADEGEGEAGAARPADGSDLGAGFTVDALGSTCVICLTEPCEVAVRPCNHLCLCAACSNKLVSDSNFERRKCPICRAPLGSLLRIISNAPPRELPPPAAPGARLAAAAPSGEGETAAAGGVDGIAARASLRPPDGSPLAGR